jgi:hypothetical protein
MVYRSFANSRPNQAVALQPMARFKRHAKVNPPRRQPDGPTRPQNPLSARSEFNMAAAADHSVRGHRNRRARRRGLDGSANAKALREMGRDEAAALATAQMLAEAPKDRSADLLFAVALHDSALEIMRLKCRSVSVARRLEIRRRSDVILARARARCLAFLRPRVAWRTTDRSRRPGRSYANLRRAWHSRVAA